MFHESSRVTAIRDESPICQNKHTHSVKFRPRLVFLPIPLLETDVSIFASSVTGTRGSSQTAIPHGVATITAPVSRVSFNLLQFRSPASCWTDA